MSTMICFKLSSLKYLILIKLKTDHRFVLVVPLLTLMYDWDDDGAGIVQDSK